MWIAACICLVGSIAQFPRSSAIAFKAQYQKSAAAGLPGLDFRGNVIHQNDTHAQFIYILFT